MEDIYHNKELVKSIKQSMKEYYNGEGVVIHSKEELDSYFNSL